MKESAKITIIITVSIVGPALLAYPLGILAMKLFGHGGIDPRITTYSIVLEKETYYTEKSILIEFDNRYDEMNPLLQDESFVIPPDTKENLCDTETGICRGGTYLIFKGIKECTGFKPSETKIEDGWCFDYISEEGETCLGIVSRYGNRKIKLDAFGDCYILKEI